MSTFWAVLVAVLLVCLLYGLLSQALLARQTKQRELRELLLRPVRWLAGLGFVRRGWKTLRWRALLPWQFERDKRRVPLDELGVLFVEKGPGNGLRDLSANFRLLYDRLQFGSGYHLGAVYLDVRNPSGKARRKAQRAFLQALAGAKYVFINDCCETLDALRLRPGTQVINTWHGCGSFKKWGYASAGTLWGQDSDLERFAVYTKETLVTVSSRDVAGDYRSAMNIPPSRGAVRALGVSRTDVFFDEAFARRALARVHAAVPQSRDKRILLYAPTFRGSAAAAEAPTALDLGALHTALADGWVLLIQHHAFVSRRPEIPEEYADFAVDVTAQLEIDELMVACDVCITDYSSLMFEYALLNKPMVFYAFDLEDYTRDRGFFRPYEELVPGPICRTNAQLVQALRSLETGWNAAAMARLHQTYMSACDGSSTSRILAAVFPERFAPATTDPETVKVSVIVPVYKAEQYLRQCLDSIAEQTHRNLEVILIDDGSPDGCGAICDGYAARDSRFQVLHQENRGVSAARNAALARVTGDLVAFCDSDDWLEPDAYAAVVELLLRTGADACFHGFVLERENGKHERCPSPKAFFGVGDQAQLVHQMLLPRRGYWGILCNKVFSARAVRRDDGSLITFREEVKVEEDQLWMLEVLQRLHRGVFTFLPLYHYRYYSGSASNYDLKELPLVQTHWNTRLLVTDTAAAFTGVSRDICDLARFNFVHQRLRNAYYQGAKQTARFLSQAVTPAMAAFDRSAVFSRGEKLSFRFLRLCIALHFPGWLYQSARNIVKGPRRGRAVGDLAKQLLYRMIPLTRAIVFESFPDFSDNAYWFARYLAEHTDVFSRYRLVWWVRERSLAREELFGVPVTCIYDRARSLPERLRRFYYLSASQYLIDCNSFRRKRKDNQIRIHLGHGAPIKYVPVYAANAGTIDLLTITAEHWRKFYVTQYKTPSERVLSLGFPRNDILTAGASLTRPEALAGQKLVLWMPTYRQHQNRKQQYRMKEVFPLGIPVFRTDRELAQLDGWLAAQNMTLLLRPHPSQDLRVFRAHGMTRLRIADDAFLQSCGLQLYQLLAMADGLITDYSSVYYDFLLTDKPIALTIQDLEEFTQTFSLAVDYRQDIAGTCVKTAQELYAFLENVQTGRDPDRAARTAAKLHFNAVIDGTASERLYQQLHQRFGL